MEEKCKVPAVEKADKIFNYLYYNEAATQAEISRELEISKASVNRLLAVLLELKYLSFEDRKYSLGEKFYFFANKYDIKNATKTPLAIIIPYHLIGAPKISNATGFIFTISRFYLILFSSLIKKLTH